MTSRSGRGGDTAIRSRSPGRAQPPRAVDGWRLQAGTYNERMAYWPVRARAKGICVPDNSLMAGWTEKPFDGQGEFHLRQDDFGKWEAEIEGFQALPPIVA